MVHCNSHHWTYWLLLMGTGVQQLGGAVPHCLPTPQMFKKLCEVDKQKVHMSFSHNIKIQCVPLKLIDIILGQERSTASHNAEFTHGICGPLAYVR